LTQGATLLINGIPAPIQFANASQINAQVPFEVAPGPAVAELHAPGMPPAAIAFTVTLAAPGIFAGYQNQAAVQNADGSVNSPANPAAPASLITVYLTGQGKVAPPVATGAPAPAEPMACASYPVTATVQGLPALVTFAGLSPGSVGLFQVNLRVPEMSSGTFPIEVSVNGIGSGSRLVSVLGER
jgi:uncharacterized protein (TIGR03437 family)